MILYHYTSEFHLPLIEESGYLKPTESNLHPTIEHYGPDCVWLLDEPELRYGHGLNDAPPGWVIPDKTRVRFTVDVPDLWVRPWLTWAEAQDIDKRWLKALLAGATGGREAASHWQAVFRRIPRERWVSVDMV